MREFVRHMFGPDTIAWETDVTCDSCDSGYRVVLSYEENDRAKGFRPNEWQGPCPFCGILARLDLSRRKGT